MISFRTRGNFNNAERFLKRNLKMSYSDVLRKYAEEGVRALSSATPVDTGVTAASWNYEINKTNEGYSVIWKNSNIQKGVNIALILQYGHGTRNGGYVQGRDYINPALRPIFEKMADAAWKEVKKI